MPFLIALPRAVRAEAKSIVVLALPVIAGQLSTMGMNLIDVVLAGHLGVAVLAPVALGTSVWMLAVVLLSGVMMAVPAMVAHLDGAGRQPEIWALFRQAMWLAVLIGATLTGVVGIVGPHVMVWIGVTPDLARDGAVFLHAVAWGAPALGILFACRGLADGLSRTRHSFAFSLLGPVCLAPVGYVLMYGRLGVPPMGVAGSGYATAIVLWVQAGTFLLFVCTSRRYAPLSRKTGSRQPHLDSWRALLRIGGPAGVTLLMEGGLFIATALVIGRLGEAAMASHQIAFNVVSLLFMVPLGLSMAITIRVAHANGRGDAKGVRRAGLTGIGLAFGAQCISAMCLLSLPGLIVRCYTSDTTIVAAAVVLLQLAGLFQLSDGLQVAANGALRGLKDTRVPMLLTLVAYWCIGMPVGVFLAIRCDMGAPGMWIGLLAGLSTAAALLLTRFVRVTAPRRRTAATSLPTSATPVPSGVDAKVD